MATSEVRRGDFVYRDVLLVDIGDNKRHPRASVPELRSLLIPKRGQLVPKDQVAHWYEAQLLHYGLDRTRDKNTAKVRLTTAIAAGRLAVPTRIAALEADMKKEFTTASRKAKNAAKKAQEADSVKVSATSGKKRKTNSDNDVQEVNSRTKVSVRVGNVTFDIDHSDSATAGKKRQKTTSAPAKSTPAKSASAKSSPANPTVTSRSTKSAVASKPQSPAKKATASRSTQGARTPAAASSPSSSTNRVVKKQTTKRGNFSGGAASRPQASTQPRVTHEHKSNHLSKTPQYHSDNNDDDDEAPPPYDSLDFSHTDNDSDIQYEPGLQISGTYEVFSDIAPSELTLVKDPTTNQFWADFLIGPYQGILHIPDITGITTGQRVTFNWRAEDTRSGALRFRRDQQGWIEFDGHGRFRGCWYGIMSDYKDDDRDVEFEGDLRGPHHYDVDDLIDRWEWFVESAYGR